MRFEETDERIKPKFPAAPFRSSWLPGTPPELRIAQNPTLALVCKDRTTARSSLGGGTAILDFRNEWSEDLNQDLPLGFGLYVLGFIALCAVVGGSFKYGFEGWRTMFEQCRRSHLDENINLVSKRIAEAIGTDQGWNWFRPANWGDCYFVTVGGCLVLINLTEDWIRYVVAESVRDVRYDCRRVGSTSQSESRAHTIGAGSYLFTASTTVESTGQTVDSYRHVVDIYTTEQGNEHLCADFGADEALAKRAYACLSPLSERPAYREDNAAL